MEKLSVPYSKVVLSDAGGKATHGDFGFLFKLACLLGEKQLASLDS